MQLYLGEWKEMGERKKEATAIGGEGINIKKKKDRENNFFSPGL